MKSYYNGGRGSKRYDYGYRYCSRCNEWQETDRIACQDCNLKLRSRPRQFTDQVKERLGIKIVRY